MAEERFKTEEIYFPKKNVKKRERRRGKKEREEKRKKGRDNK